MDPCGNDRLTHPSVILVASNLSDLHRLMPIALQMGTETGASLKLLHVLSPGEKITADATGMVCFDREGARATARNMMDPWCDRAQRVGVKCTAILREGHSAAQEIIAAVCQLNPDRIIIGTRSLGKLGRLLLGTVAEQVLRTVDLPVFTVGPEADLVQENTGRQPAVLFATALGEGYEDNAAMAWKLADIQWAKLVILHVLPSNQMIRPDMQISGVLSELNQLAQKIGDGSQPEVDIKVAHGKPAIEILAEAAASQASLIVMGASDYSLFDSIAHDRTVCQVLAHAHCPVLSLHVSAAHRTQNHSERPASTGA